MTEETRQTDYNVEFRCYRCGAKERCRESKLDPQTDLPPGWERSMVADLCPKCQR